MAKKALEKEIEEWLESGEETALIELNEEDSTKTELKFIIGEEEEPFSISIPSEYKKDGDHRFVNFFKKTFFS